MNLAARTTVCFGILITIGIGIRAGHLDRADTPADTQGAVTVAMTDTLGPCVVRETASSASHGTDVTMNVTTAIQGWTTLYVYGDHGYGMKGTWHGNAGTFTWHTNLAHSTVKGVKNVSGFIVGMDGMRHDCVVNK